MSDSYLEQLLVDADQEQAYCQTHGIIFRRMSNGISLVTVNRSIKDSVFTGIHLQFNAGSWFDPIGKKGAHHLLEHFFNQPIRAHAANHDCELNAYTSSLRLGEYLGGPANLQMKDFGVWQVIDDVCGVVKDPFSRHKNIERFFKNEKKVVLAEHASNLASHEWYVANIMYTWLFDEKNPVTDYPLGTPETLKSLTLNDLKEVMEQTLVPKNCVVNTVTDSTYTTGLELTDRIEANLRDFPRVASPKTHLPIENMKLFNTEIKPGEVHYFDHGIKNGQTTLLLGWQCQFPQFSTKDISLGRITEEFGQKAFELARDKGWSYNINSNTVYPSNETGAFFVIVDLLSSPSLTERKIKSIVKQFAAAMKLSDREVGTLVEKEKLRQLTWPVSIESRMNWIVTGLLNYNRLIDIDKIIQTHLMVERSDYQYWIDYITNSEPFIGVVGSKM